MRARVLAAATIATVLAVVLSGCVTVHGEQAVVPAISKAKAKQVLEHFTRTTNKANKTYDAKLNATVEAGALGAIDQAGLRARKEVHGERNKNYQPLKLTDARFLIPRQAGWPKSFVADTKSNRKDNARWYLVFQRHSVDEKWKATYLAVLEKSETPQFVFGEDGWVEDVPAGQGDGQLAIAPDKLSKAYTTYLRQGGDGFAPGRHTSEWRDKRRKKAEKPGVRIEWADLPAKPPRFEPFGLRTKDGGALVFFASHHHKKRTVAKGYTPEVKNPYVEALMTGEPKQSITIVRVSQQAATVPPAKKDGRVTFLSRISGVTSAKGA